ncbi:SH3 domain-containing kinase-binding protein 1-like [Watersipora subatra]|uniref:SH3 domain-containing kinase-binding protein 1-like n=1 Tax=Watersipora subatra TaxID=2589382 RepID=UPI00355BABA5
MSSTAKRTIVEVSVRDIEKRYQPIRCYKFVLEVTWSDKSRYVVYRSYSEFMEIHITLMKAFPLEAGEIDPNDRVLPELEGSSIFSRGEVQKVAAKRRSEITDYCNRLMTLQPKISQFPKLLTFFELRSDDLNVPSNSKMKKSSPFTSIGKKLKKKQKKRNKEDNLPDPKFEVTHPLLLETYVVAFNYKAAGKGQINLSKGTKVDVIDKNENGWWYVSCDGAEGWAPATYLDKTSDGDTSKDEVLCLGGEMFLTVKAYKAQLDDELSFGSQVVVEVLNKVLDGWWIASYNQKVGYAPSTYLKAYKNPYLRSSPQSPSNADGSPLMPTPRRQSIIPDSPSTRRDLQPYRRATEKRRQRTIKQRKSNEKDNTELNINLSLILEGDDDYLDPNLQSNNFSQSSIYIDPDQQNGLKEATPDVTVSSAKVSENPLAVKVKPRSRQNNLRVERSLGVQSKLSDTDGYEPVSTYDKKATDVIVPAYRAPGAPATHPDDYLKPKPRSFNVNNRFTLDGEYEPVVTKRASTLPPVISECKTDHGQKLPPPKPDEALLTRLNIEDDDYDYSPILIPPKPPTRISVSGNSSQITPPPRRSQVLKTSGNGTDGKTRPTASPRSPLDKPKDAAPKSNTAPPKAPRQIPQSQTPVVMATEASYSQNLNISVKSVKVNENNNNTDGKIYEEFLVKPSQLKGRKNANVRVPK